MSGDDPIIEMMETALHRFPFLDGLEDEPKDKRTLVAELDCSRSTVDRGIRKLEALDLVDYADGGYRLTSLGELVATNFADLADTVELRLQYAPFLEWIPDDEFDLELELLRDADLLLPEQGDPYAMINRHVATIDQADTMKAVLPLTGLHAQQTAHTRVVENGAEIELVVTPEVANTMQSDPDYAELTEDMAATGRFEIYEFDGDIPYFVGLLDDIVQIGADEAGEPRAIVETENDDVRLWAETTFEEYKQHAEPVISPQERTKLRT